MIFSSAFTVYALGLRHGADPDHLAAIDNVTRNSMKRAPRLSRFAGALFAGGHTVMVLAIAALAGYLGSRFVVHGALIETIGTWVSIVVLLLLAGMNLRQLSSGQNDRAFGMKTRLLPRALREGTSPWLAIPIGLLFGFGFETSSQIATYAAAFAADAGVTGALVVGSTFCLGMICTDTLDSLFVHRIVSYRSGSLPRVMRVWIWSVTGFAVAVAAYELAQVLGWKPPVSDLTVSIALVSALFVVFVWIFVATRDTSPRRTHGANIMKVLRSLATIVTTALVVAVISLYGVHAARGSDHQDSPTVVARPGADITDVFAYPAPDNPTSNVVLAMDVYPLIPQGMSSNSVYAFDPAVLYQFKIANGIANKNYTESTVIQFTVSGTGQSERLTMYGPAAPAQASVSDTIVTSAKMGTVSFNAPASLDGGKIQVFAGARRDPFFFDLAQFFKIIPDRNAAYHAAGQTVPAPTATSFNGFAAGNPNGCLTAPASDFLANYNVLQIDVELPKTMLEPNGASLGKIGLWATTSTTTGS